MPLPSHRLDLLLVPRGARAGALVREALSDLRSRGVVDATQGAGAEAGWLVAGGFARIRADVHEEPRLWANQAGGFQARCPSCGEGVARGLQAVIDEGGLQPVECPGCGWHGPLTDVDFRPPAAWGPAALVIADAESATLTDSGREWADRALGSWARIWRRP